MKILIKFDSHLCFNSKKKKKASKSSRPAHTRPCLITGRGLREAARLHLRQAGTSRGGCHQGEVSRLSSPVPRSPPQALCRQHIQKVSFLTRERQRCPRPPDFHGACPLSHSVFLSQLVKHVLGALQARARQMGKGRGPSARMARGEPPTPRSASPALKSVLWLLTQNRATIIPAMWGKGTCVYTMVTQPRPQGQAYNKCSISVHLPCLFI